MTRPAPISHEERAAARPTGPAPNTITVSPSDDVAELRAEVAGREGVRQQQGVLVGKSSGITEGPTSANGTRTRSACPPS